MGNRNTSDPVAGVHMISAGNSIERSVGAGFGEVGEEENRGTESRTESNQRVQRVVCQRASGPCLSLPGGAKLSKEVKRLPGKLPVIILLLSFCCWRRSGAV